ncbi:hypothetical protein Scep_004925 [Stephania cephalantha]|uniref:Uncharacterized protein n=1 Tax=Stephania cephalantha TaxID=152367 RepID=A0AAP0PZK9_9MAGN
MEQKVIVVRKVIVVKNQRRTVETKEKVIQDKVVMMRKVETKEKKRQKKKKKKNDKLPRQRISSLNQSHAATSAVLITADAKSRFAKFVEIILIPRIIVHVIHNLVKQLIDSQQQFRQLFDEIRQIDFRIPSLKDLETQLNQYNARLYSMTDEEELCNTQPIFNPEEDVSVDTLKIFEVNEVTQMEDYLRETSKECEVFQIELEIVIALNEGENEMKIDVISDKPEKP